MTPNQKKIIAFAMQNNRHITKKQAVELLGHCYYCNPSFHVGNTLSRMVKSGILARVKPGHFRLLQCPQGMPVTVDPNQLMLFC